MTAFMSEPEAEFVPLMVFCTVTPVLIATAMNTEHVTQLFNTKAPAEFLDQRELFSESDITSAVAFFQILLYSSSCAIFFFNSRISTCSGVMGDAFGKMPLRSSLSC